MCKADSPLLKLSTQSFSELHKYSHSLTRFFRSTCQKLLKWSTSSFSTFLLYSTFHISISSIHCPCHFFKLFFELIMMVWFVHIYIYGFPICYAQSQLEKIAWMISFSLNNLSNLSFINTLFSEWNIKQNRWWCIYFNGVTLALSSTSKLWSV